MDSSKVRTTPMDFFLQLGVFAALFVSVISFLNLLFETINAAFPDDLNQYVDPYAGALRFSIASLLIVFPLFLFLSRLISRDYEKNLEKRSMGLRKWLLYLTLFIAGIAIIVDLIFLINEFLGGELTTRFLLKAGAVLIVAGGVFWYYLTDARRERPLPVRTRNSIIAGLVVVVLASIVGGFSIIGSPMELRAKRLDAQRLMDLQNIQWQVVQYWQQKEILPQTLSGVNDPLVGGMLPVDPETKQPYVYKVVGERTFELCATFNTEGDASNGYRPHSMAFPATEPGIKGSENWKHSAGEACFRREIDPDRFPPIPTKALMR